MLLRPELRMGDYTWWVHSYFPLLLNSDGLRGGNLARRRLDCVNVIYRKTMVLRYRNSMILLNHDLTI
jgi:hypothetical protein